MDEIVKNRAGLRDTQIIQRHTQTVHLAGAEAAPPEREQRG